MLGFGFFASMAIGTAKIIYIATKKPDSPPDPKIELAGKGTAMFVSAAAHAADAGIKAALNHW